MGGMGIGLGAQGRDEHSSVPVRVYIRLRLEGAADRLRLRGVGPAGAVAGGADAPSKGRRGGAACSLI